MRWWATAEGTEGVVSWQEGSDGAAARQAVGVGVSQKTSRQQAVTPRLGGRAAVVEVKVSGVRGILERRSVEERWAGVWCCDCRRTRTTSRGVTGRY